MMNNKMDFSTLIIIAILLLIIIFSPQLTNLSKGMIVITGADTEGTTVVNISVSNQPPKIPNANVSSVGSQSIVLNSNKLVSFTFVACDPDGNADIDRACGNFTGEFSFFDSNISCSKTAWSNTTCAEFNCSTNIWYYYKAGSWNASMNITDGSNWAYNNISTFQLGETAGMVISPSALNWASLNMDSWNLTSSNDPILVNNTGNYNVSVSKVNITGYDLKGELDITKYIPTANFTADIETGGACSGGDCIECLGTNLVNATSTDITNSMLPRGNNSINDGSVGQEQLYICLMHVPPSTLISAQSYSTIGSSQWVVGVS